MPNLDETSPVAGPKGHVFVAAGGGLCFCGSPRFTAVHVGYDGTPEPDLEGLREHLDAIDAASAAARSILDGAVRR